MASTNTRFTAIGMSGSGKTCYVVGMYYQMITGYKGFSLKAGKDSVRRLEDWMEMLDDKSGQERFPAGTAVTAVNDYEFKLKYALQDVMTFNWIDYGGGVLKAREDGGEAYQMLHDSIEESPVLYVFLDGELLCHQDNESRTKALKKSVRTINAFLMDYSESHQDEMLPIVFVITKADLCLEYVDNEDIITIMKECFDFLMVKGIRFYVTMVSLGKEIADEDYSGEVDPEYMHLPFFIGIYHTFMNFCFALKSEILEEEQRNQGTISDKQNAIYKERNKTKFEFLNDLLCKENKIDLYKQQIASANEAIQSNQELLTHYKKLMNAVSSQLLRDSVHFKMFEDGIEKEFDTSESVKL